MTDASSAWPELRADDWTPARDTLHRMTQIAGKIRLAFEPPVNHSWHVALYVTPRGLTTSPIHLPRGASVSIDFDFVAHESRIAWSDGTVDAVPLEKTSVAAYYRAVVESFSRRGVTPKLDPRPSEIANAEPLDRDEAHAGYEPGAVHRFHCALRSADRLCRTFRAGFLGKASPVHFFWGSFDLATTRFSGRIAPPHPGGIPALSDRVTRDAYSHEEFSVGFWPGGSGFDALFYAYAYPAPDGFAASAVQPSAATWHDTLKEFVLPYDAVRMSSDPDRAVLDFFSSTYDAAARLLDWDRDGLDYRPAPTGSPTPTSVVET